MYLKQYGCSKKEEEKLFTIEKSYSYWRETLFEKCCRIFVWDGLKFPQKEIETRLLLNGYCGYIDDILKGEMVASGSLSGVTQYYDEFTNFTYSAPTARGGTKTIGNKCVIINNTSLRNPLFPMICRYSSLLAHSEISLKVALINLRESNTFCAENQETADSVREYHKKIYNGALDVIIDDSLVNSVQNITSQQTKTSIISDCIDARNEILRAFFNEIGVRYTRDKSERMTTTEVDNDDQMLLINIMDMLHQREEACKQINKIFKTNISVKLSDEFSLIGNGVNNNDVK